LFFWSPLLGKIEASPLTLNEKHKILKIVLLNRETNEKRKQQSSKLEPSLTDQPKRKVYLDGRIQEVDSADNSSLCSDDTDKQTYSLDNFRSEGTAIKIVNYAKSSTPMLYG
jgi:hypothetical protein